MSGREPIVGIDLGTSRSLVAAVKDRRPVVLSGDGAVASLPSVVAFLSDGDVLVGESAVNQRALNPSRTIEGAKRFLGRKFEELSDVERAYPFPLTRMSDGYVGLLVGDRVLRPEEVSAKVLSALVRRAEIELCRTVSRAVIAVPAWFGEPQRQATNAAAELAGIQVVRLVTESIAAGLAYGVENRELRRFAVFDVGAGTFNVSIIESGDGVLETLGTDGDAHAGGDAFTDALAQHLAVSFARTDGVDLRLDVGAMHRIREAAEVAKIGLSSLREVSVVVPAIARVAGTWRDLRVPMTRAAFEAVTAHLVARYSEPCGRALRDAGLGPRSISETLLIGGSTRIPHVQEAARRALRCGALCHRANPDEAVALGAAVQAGVLMGEIGGVILLQSRSQSVGIGVAGDGVETVVPRQTVVPTSKCEHFTTARDGQTSVAIVVVEGDRGKISESVILGCFNLDGISPAPAGAARIMITVEIDASGLPTVTARDQATGRSATTKGLGRVPVSSRQSESILRRAKECPIRRATDQN